MIRMSLEELLQSPELALLGEMALEQSKQKLERKYTALNRLAVIGKTVMAGDSIVEYFPIQEFFGDDIYNRGIGGDTSEEALRRLPNTVLPLKPKTTLIWVGTNDIQAGVLTEDTVRNVEAIGNQLERCCCSEILLLSVAPVNMLNPNPEIRNTVGKRTNAAIQALNQSYRELCIKKGWRLIDVYPLLERDGSLPDELSEDGLHPNVAGYIPVAAAIKAALN